MSSKSKRILIKTLKIFGKILGVILLLLLLIVLFVRSPWGQGIIVDKVVNYVEDKTQTEVAIEKLFITFDGNVSLDGLYLEDKQGDTLVYSKHLEAEIPLWSIINGGGIGINDVSWQGLRANIIRKDSVNGFNYQFLIDAFATADTTSVSQTPQDTTGIQLDLGDFEFSDFEIKYEDAVSGMLADLDLGNLSLRMQETDLERMIFDVAETRIQNTQVVYRQTKPLPPSTDTTEVPLPIINIGDLVLDQVNFEYDAAPQGIQAQGDTK